jgi:electron transfer flavoprotein alpha/beta subunit
MNIIVTVKQVPDTNDVRIDPETGTLIREGVPSIVNPEDRHAVELALALTETAGAGTVTVISMGPPQAEAALREVLAMGADRAILVSDRAFAGADTLATANTLADAKPSTATPPKSDRNWQSFWAFHRSPMLPGSNSMGKPCVSSGPWKGKPRF